MTIRFLTYIIFCCCALSINTSAASRSDITFDFNDDLLKGGSISIYELNSESLYQKYPGLKNVLKMASDYILDKYKGSSRWMWFQTYIVSLGFKCYSIDISLGWLYFKYENVKYINAFGITFILTESKAIQKEHDTYYYYSDFSDLPITGDSLIIDRGVPIFDDSPYLHWNVCFGLPSQMEVLR